MKFAALILTCQKLQYVQRRTQQLETIKNLKELGADIFYLYGDTTSESSYIKDESLYVPVAEDYEYIPLRIFKGFEYLRSQEYQGILKMDDDIQITNKEAFARALVGILHNPYAAVKSVGGREILNKQDIIVVNTYPWKKCKESILNSTYAMYPSVEYASGPIYWIGIDLLKRLQESDYSKCIFEDVCSGIAAKKYGISLSHTHILFNQAIKGDDSPWPYRQYTMRNEDLYRHFIYS